MTRKPIMAGNWKMNIDHIEATGLVEKLHFTLVDKEWDPEKSDAVLCVPFTDLRTVRTLIDGDRLKFGLGAQNVSQHDNGAYTGEISTTMLSKLGVQYVIVGHSERRQYYGEDDALINAKAAKVLAAGMTPIICVGEGLDIRKAGEHVEYTLGQVRGTLANLTAEQVAGLVIAYEPSGPSAPARSPPRTTPRRCAAPSARRSPNSTTRPPPSPCASSTAAP